jgi:hypothetical protein
VAYGGSQEQDLVKEISSLRSDLQLSGYPHSFIDSIIYFRGRSHLNKEQKPLGSVYIPHVKDVSEKFKHMGNWYNIRTIFKTKHTLRSSFMKIRPERDPQETAQCIYSIPCECGRPLVMQLHEHRHNLQQGLLEKSKLGQHDYDEGHRVG